MKIVVFGPDKHAGALVGDKVVDLGAADPSLPSSLLALIEMGEAGLEKAQRVVDQIDRAPDGAVHAASGVKLQAPWPGKRFAMAGGNYARHMLSFMAMAAPTAPRPTFDEATAKIREGGVWGFWKLSLPVAGPSDEVAKPKKTRYFDYEGEVAIVLGKPVKDFKGSKIDDLVWGVTLLNDFSLRDIVPSGRPLNYNLAKNFDGSTAMGPCISVGELDFRNLDVDTTVDGLVRQRFSTREMVFSFEEMLAVLSVDFTFVPGDVLSGGTGAGTAGDSTGGYKLPDGTRPLDLFLRPGQVVEVSSPGIGALRNRIV